MEIVMVLCTHTFTITRGMSINLEQDGWFHHTLAEMGEIPHLFIETLLSDWSKVLSRKWRRGLKLAPNNFQQVWPSPLPCANEDKSVISGSKYAWIEKTLWANEQMINKSARMSNKSARMSNKCARMCKYARDVKIRKRCENNQDTVWPLVVLNPSSGAYDIKLHCPYYPLTPSDSYVDCFQGHAELKRDKCFPVLNTGISHASNNADASLGALVVSKMREMRRQNAWNASFASSCAVCGDRSRQLHFPDRRWILPCIGIFPIMLFFYRNAFLIMKLSNPPIFRPIRAVIISQSTFEI